MVSGGSDKTRRFGGGGGMAAGLAAGVATLRGRLRRATRREHPAWPLHSRADARIAGTRTTRPSRNAWTATRTGCARGSARPPAAWQRFAIGPASAGRVTGAVTMAGPGCWLLAWLIGRDDGTALTVSAGPAGAGQEPAAGHGGLPPKLPKWA